MLQPKSKKWPWNWICRKDRFRGMTGIILDMAQEVKGPVLVLDPKADPENRVRVFARSAEAE